ncbi:phosphoribosyl-dephospho-CoA transferase MdcG domain-containing protein [Kitasatospora sp. NPDC089509]|uniref:phosphoribosyl-dephospho-CoA transferase MdcG domain-containing protein n=1 Tax=Kitasatospora sp. NPDC089509 TaxID=3364079 RepID=UPI00382ACC10
MPTVAPHHVLDPDEQPHGALRRPLAPLNGQLPVAHDLLLLRYPGALRPLDRGGPPNWARQTLRTHPWVTVARAPSVTGPGEPWVPVMVRGPQRGQRFDAMAPRSTVARILRPEQLTDRLKLLPPRRVAAIPGLAALRAVTGLITDHRLAWGPIGAIGYELATGEPVAGPLSPLRLVLRAPAWLSRRDAMKLWRELGRLDVELDAELEIRNHVVPLDRYARGTVGRANSGRHPAQAAMSRVLRAMPRQVLHDIRQGESSHRGRRR